MAENFEEPGHTLQGPHLFGGRDAPLGFAALWLEIQATGQRLELSREAVVIGRHSGADLRLAYPDISRRHCRVAFQDRHWQIFDLNSLNGIYINGERILEAILYEGDQIRLGNLVFIVQDGACVRTQPKNVMLKSIAEVLPSQRRAG